MDDPLIERALEVLAEVMNDDTADPRDRLTAALNILREAPKPLTDAQREYMARAQSRDDELLGELREIRAVLSERVTLEVR